MPLTRLTLEERIRCIRYYSMYSKASYIQKAWRRDFNTDPPSRKTITALNKKFDETGSVADLSRSGRPKSSRTEEKVALVQAALLKDPTKSIRSLSNELGVNKAAVHRIKQETEKKKNTLKIENKKLKEKVAEYRRKIDSLEEKAAAKEEKILIIGANQNIKEDKKYIKIKKEKAEKSEEVPPNSIHLLNEKFEIIEHHPHPTLTVTLPSSTMSAPQSNATTTTYLVATPTLQLVQTENETIEIRQLQLEPADEEMVSSENLEESQIINVTEGTTIGHACTSTSGGNVSCAMCSFLASHAQSR